MKLSKTLLWRAALCILAAISLLLVLSVWQSGARETQEAFLSGRRLVINRETGMIQGKIIAAMPEGDRVEAKSENAPPAEEKPLDSFNFLAAKEMQSSSLKEDQDKNKPELLDSFHAVAEPPSPAPAAAETPKPTELTAQEKNRQEKEDEVKIAEAIRSAPILSGAPTITPSANALPDVNSKLTEQSENGVLPVIGADGTKPWKYYAKPANYKKGTPVIAIIVTGLGQNKIVTENAVNLPEMISLSFTPYSRDTAGWGKASRLTGHETLIDLPLEPSNYPVTDPGPKGLLISKGPQENEKRLEWIMSRYPTGIGFVTSQNEHFSGDVEGFKLLLQSIANRGLLIIMGAEPHKSETKTLVESSTTPLVVADMLIDEELSASAMQMRFTSLEVLAKKRGYAVGILQPYPISIEQLRSWAETLKDKGIILVPVSTIAKLRFS